jgi:uncharacterized membrane protein YtjA (UPF0391 family)
MGSAASIPKRLSYFRPVPLATYDHGGDTMLRWALAFLVLALIAAFLGFGGIAAASAGIAKTLFFIFLIIFAVTLILGLAAGKRIASP